MVFTTCPNYWQRGYYCDKCQALHKAGARWHCTLHRKDICVLCEPGKGEGEEKSGIKCPSGKDHWMSWAKNGNPRRKTYMCAECGRCYMNRSLRWHCRVHDVDLCFDCEPGLAQRLRAGHRVKWMGSSEKTKALMENIGNGDTNLLKVAADSIGEVKHLVDDEWAAVSFPEGTWDIKRTDLLTVTDKNAVAGMCGRCGCLGVPGREDPETDVFYCEGCCGDLVTETDSTPEGKSPDVTCEKHAPVIDHVAPWDYSRAQEQQTSREPKQRIYWDRDVGVRLASAATGSCFEPGSEVVVVNLLDRPENNGRGGEVVRYDATDNRYVVRPEGTMKQVKVRPENLAAVPEHRYCRWWQNDELEVKTKNVQEFANGQASSPQRLRDALPEGWRSAVDPSSGRQYYWPLADRSQVSWERPTAPAR